MRLPRALYDEIKAHVLESAPRECCGLVACNGVGPVRVYRASNVALNPYEAYEVDPDDQLYLMAEIERERLTLGAVYHSHPCSTPTPSLHDMRAPYPGVLHIIVGMGHGLVMRAWELGNTARPVELEVV